MAELRPIRESQASYVPKTTLTGKWHLLYGDAVSVTAYLDKENTFVGFDFWGSTRRTKVLTRFFNIVVEDIDVHFFDRFPC